MKVGDIICINGHTWNPKRVVFSKRLGCQALQNAQNDENMLFRDDENEQLFFGSIEDCFTLPEKFQGEIEIIGFQEVKNAPEESLEAQKQQPTQKALH